MAHLPTGSTSVESEYFPKSLGDSQDILQQIWGDCLCCLSSAGNHVVSDISDKNFKRISIKIGTTELSKSERVKAKTLRKSAGQTF